MPGKPTVTKTLRLPYELAEQSERAAADAGISWNQLCVDALAAYLKKEGK